MAVFGIGVPELMICGFPALIAAVVVLMLKRNKKDGGAPASPPTAAAAQNMKIKPLAGPATRLRYGLMLSIGLVATSAAIEAYLYYVIARNTYVNPRVMLGQIVPYPSRAERTITTWAYWNSLASVPILVVLVVTGILYLMWLHRITKNLRALSGQPMKATPGWAVGWNFVPIANWFMPYQVMKEIWQVSHGNSVSNWLVGWWWALWITSGLVGRIASAVAPSASSVPGALTALGTSLFSNAVTLIMIVVTMNLVISVGVAYSENIIEPTDMLREGAVT